MLTRPRVQSIPNLLLDGHSPCAVLLGHVIEPLLRPLELVLQPLRIGHGLGVCLHASHGIRQGLQFFADLGLGRPQHLYLLLSFLLLRQQGLHSPVAGCGEVGGELVSKGSSVTVATQQVD